METWPKEGFREVAELLLPVRDSMISKTDNAYSVNRDEVMKVALDIHMDAIRLSNAYYLET